MASESGRAPRTLCLISSAGKYGAETMVLGLVKNLNAMGRRSTLGVLLNRHLPNTELAEAATAAGVAVELIPCKGKLDFGMVRELRALACRERIDIVHAHGYKADVYSYFAFRRTPVALVSTCHNWVETSLSTKLYGALDRFLLKRFAAVVAVSDGVAERVRQAGVDGRRLHMIDNGVDLPVFSSSAAAVREEIPTKNVLVGLVGRLSPEKGVEHFIHAAALVVKNYPSTMFVIAGDGPQRQDLEQLAAASGLRENLRFLGRRQDMPAIYASLDIFVLSSLDEGLPMAILEAFASRCAVVATRVGGIPKVIAHEQNGLLVPARDPGALAEAISSLIANADLRRKLAENGRRSAEQDFSARVMAERYAKLYDRVAGARFASNVSARSEASP